MKIAFLGDIAARGFEDTLNRESAREILSPILPELLRADLRVANWENPTVTRLSPIEKSGPALWSRPQNIGFLQAAQVDLAVLANNHAGDQGPQGTLETMRHLARAGIETVGAGESLESACRPAILEKDGERAAIFAVCEHEFGGAEEATPGSAPYDHIRLTRMIREYRTRADFVLAVMHCGNEYCPIPSPLAVERCRDLIDAGADAVVGMHPHCMQGYERYHDGQIVYSTGNFFFGYPSQASRAVGWHYGYVPVVELAAGRAARLEIIPYQLAKDCSRIAPFQGEKKAEILRYLDRLNEPIRNPRLLRFLYDGWCAHVGDMYAPGLRYRPEYAAGAVDQQLFGTGNLLRCEAHHELLCNYFKNLMQRRCAEARRGIEPVLALSRAPVTLFEGE